MNIVLIVNSNCCSQLNDASAGAFQAGQVVEVADGPAGAEEKPRPGGGVGVAGPVGPGVVDAMPTGVLVFRGSDPLRVPRLHAIQ